MRDPFVVGIVGSSDLLIESKTSALLPTLPPNFSPVVHSPALVPSYDASSNTLFLELCGTHDARVLARLAAQPATDQSWDQVLGDASDAERHAAGVLLSLCNLIIFFYPTTTPVADIASAINEFVATAAPWCRTSSHRCTLAVVLQVATIASLVGGEPDVRRRLAQPHMKMKLDTSPRRQVIQKTLHRLLERKTLGVLAPGVRPAAPHFVFFALPTLGVGAASGATSVLAAMARSSQTQPDAHDGAADMLTLLALLEQDDMSSLPRGHWGLAGLRALLLDRRSVHEKRILKREAIAREKKAEEEEEEEEEEEDGASDWLAWLQQQMEHIAACRAAPVELAEDVTRTPGETALCRLLCERAIVTAIETYHRDLPAVYPAQTHLDHVAHALTEFDRLARGCEVNASRKALSARLDELWSHERRQCESVSLTGRPCTRSCGHEGVHCSGYESVHTCSCGATVSPVRRPDPFRAVDANIEFYRSADAACAVCRGSADVNTGRVGLWAGDDASEHWGVRRTGNAASYYSMTKQQSGSGIGALYPWDLPVVLEGQQQTQSGLVVAKAGEGRAFVGYEYECDNGHRILAGSDGPDKISRSARGAGSRIVSSEHPIQRTCSACDSATVSRLQRLHVVVPRHRTDLALNLRIEITPSPSTTTTTPRAPFVIGAQVSLPRDSLIVVRLPHTYSPPSSARLLPAALVALAGASSSLTNPTVVRSKGKPRL